MRTNEEQPRNCRHCDKDITGTSRRTYCCSLECDLLDDVTIALDDPTDWVARLYDLQELTHKRWETIRRENAQ